MPRVAKPFTLRARVLEFFKHNDTTLTPEQISEQFNFNRDGVRKAMSPLVAEGSVVVVQRRRHNAPVYGRPKQSIALSSIRFQSHHQEETQ